MDNYLETLIQKREGEQTEFLPHPESSFVIAKTLCAFANKEGGSLLIGIRKNGKIAGTEPSESYSAVASAAHLCTPPVLFDSVMLQSAHKIVLEIRVPKSNDVHKLFVDNTWVPYIRFKDLSLKANSVLKKYLDLKKNSPGQIGLPEETTDILSLFREDDSLTLTQIVKKTDLKREKVEMLLAQLLILNKIDMDIQENAIVYQLHKEH